MAERRGGHLAARHKYEPNCVQTSMTGGEVAAPTDTDGHFKHRGAVPTVPNAQEGQDSDHVLGTASVSLKNAKEFSY